MKSIMSGFIMIFGILALAGCANNNGPYGGHNQKWYEQHTSARHAENKWCGDQSLATQAQSKSCTAAHDGSVDAHKKRDDAKSEALLKQIQHGLPSGTLDPTPSS